MMEGLSSVSYINKQAEAAAQTLESDGGPPHDGGMEARVAKLESTSEHLLRELAEVKADLRGFRDDSGKKFNGVRDRMERDFRVLFGALIFASLGLAGLLAKGFGWL